MTSSANSGPSSKTVQPKPSQAARQPAAGITAPMIENATMNKTETSTA
jgi:hypothetical protein